MISKVRQKVDAFFHDPWVQVRRYNEYEILEEMEYAYGYTLTIVTEFVHEDTGETKSNRWLFAVDRVSKEYIDPELEAELLKGGVDE